MNLPWWLNPWREVRRLNDAAVRADYSLARMSGRLDEMCETARQDIATIETLTGRNAELARQLAVAADAGPRSGKALVGWEQQGGARPEFVLAGVDRGRAGGKRLYASKDLGGTAFGMTEMDDPPPRWKLSTAMERMLTIDKPTYGEALAHLMRIWSNWDRAGRPALEGAVRPPQPPRGIGQIQARPGRQRVVCPAGIAIRSVQYAKAGHPRNVHDDGSLCDHLGAIRIETLELPKP